MASNVCYSYQQSGQCKFGANCRFSHGDEPTAMGQGGGGFGGGGYGGGGGGGYGAPRRTAAPCYSFQESGNCKFGAQCRFSHGDDQQQQQRAVGGFGGGGYGGGGGGGRSYGFGGRSAGPCYEFRETGACKYGDNCRFSHSAGGDASGPRPGAGVCYQFKNAGNCTYGANCRFSHDLSADKKDADGIMEQQPQEAQ